MAESEDTAKAKGKEVCVYFSLFIKLIQAFPVRITLYDSLKCGYDK